MDAGTNRLWAPDRLVAIRFCSEDVPMAAGCFGTDETGRRHASAFLVGIELVADTLGAESDEWE
jgi:hypothetical protein